MADGTHSAVRSPCGQAWMGAQPAPGASRWQLWVTPAPPFPRSSESQSPWSLRTRLTLRHVPGESQGHVPVPERGPRPHVGDAGLAVSLSEDFLFSFKLRAEALPTSILSQLFSNQPRCRVLDLLPTGPGGVAGTVLGAVPWLRHGLGVKGR